MASVPELTKRIFSTVGNASTTSSARSASAGVDAPKLVPFPAAPRIASRTPGFGVAENQRAPGPDIVDVFVAVGVPDVRTESADQERSFAFDGFERADRGIDAAGNQCSARFCRRRDSSSLRGMLLLWSVCDYESINISSGDEPEQCSSRAMVLSTFDPASDHDQPSLRVTHQELPLFRPEDSHSCSLWTKLPKVSTKWQATVAVRASASALDGCSSG